MFFFFFFNDTATTEIYTLSLHDALPISDVAARDAAIAFSIAVQCGADPETIRKALCRDAAGRASGPLGAALDRIVERSEEHTSELQSRQYLVCRLLLEKKKHHTERHNRL